MQPSLYEQIIVYLTIHYNNNTEYERPKQDNSVHLELKQDKLATYKYNTPQKTA